MSDESFRALRVHKNGEISARFETLTLNDLNAGEVVIRPKYSSINYKDALAITGAGPIIKNYPLVPGIDLSGVVEHSDDQRYFPGDDVIVTGCFIGEQFDGGLAQKARVSVESLVPMPRGLNHREAMSLGTAGFTAGLALHRMLENHQTPDKGPIAVTGATGGVGSIAIDLFSKLGYEVHAVTGKVEAQGDYLRALGASEVIDRNGLELGGRPLARADLGGVVDNVGGDVLAHLITRVRQFGNVACIGLAASASLNTTVMPLILRGVSLLGIHSVECAMELRRDIWIHLAGKWHPNHLDRIVSREITLDEVPEAAAAMIAGEIAGRTIVKLSD